MKFQLLAFELGERTHKYIQSYINMRSHSDRKTGNLSKNMTFEAEAGAGDAKVAWGIGKISHLDTYAPYWYLINYGGSSWSGFYHFVPGFFDGGKFKYNPMTSEGKMLPSGIKGVIEPMSYIEATDFLLNSKLSNILNYLKTYKLKG